MRCRGDWLTYSPGGVVMAGSHDSKSSSQYRCVWGIWNISSYHDQPQHVSSLHHSLHHTGHTACYQVPRETGRQVMVMSTHEIWIWDVQLNEEKGDNRGREEDAMYDIPRGPYGPSGKRFRRCHGVMVWYKDERCKSRQSGGEIMRAQKETTNSCVHGRIMSELLESFI